MDAIKRSPHARGIEHFSHSFAGWAGSTSGFIGGALSLIAWIIAGWFYDFSTRWENAFSIYIEIIAFLMIFLMQRAQNKGLSAMHVKLNELIVASQGASNHLINAEELSESEIHEMREGHRQITRPDEEA